VASCRFLSYPISRGDLCLQVQGTDIVEELLLSEKTSVLLKSRRSNRLCARACRLRLKRDGTSAGTRFRILVKRKSPFKSAGASVQSTTDSRGVRISGINARYTMFRGSVKGTGYPLHSPVSPSIPLPCVTVCHHISIGLYLLSRVP